MGTTHLLMIMKVSKEHANIYQTHKSNLNTRTETKIYIVNVATKSAQHPHAPMIATVVEKVQTRIIYATMVSWMYQNTNRQAVEKMTSCTKQVITALLQMADSMR